jgi:hypothetical protein
MTHRFHIAGGCALAILASSTATRADDALPLRLRYSAPPSCPNADAFLAQVAARTPLARTAHANEPATELSVVIEDVPGGNTGTLELAGQDATLSMRQVSAADCAQVLSALALMTALAIDPNASTAPTPQPPPPPPAPAVPAKPVAPESPSPARWAFELGMLVEALGGVAPDPVVLPRPFVQVIRESDSPWSLALRLSAARAHAEVTVQQGAADFTWWTGRLETCPLRFSPVLRFALSACVPFDAGALQAEGRGVSPSRRLTRPWLSIGAAGRVEWQVLEVLVLEAAAELLVPIVRDRFFVGTDATLHRAPAVAAGATVGIGVRFP